MESELETVSFFSLAKITDQLLDYFYEISNLLAFHGISSNCPECDQNFAAFTVDFMEFPPSLCFLARAELCDAASRIMFETI